MSLYQSTSFSSSSTTFSAQGYKAALNEYKVSRAERQKQREQMKRNSIKKQENKQHFSVEKNKQLNDTDDSTIVVSTGAQFDLVLSPKKPLAMSTSTSRPFVQPLPPSSNTDKETNRKNIQAKASTSRHVSRVGSRQTKTSAFEKQATAKPQAKSGPDSNKILHTNLVYLPPSELAYYINERQHFEQLRECFEGDAEFMKSSTNCDPESVVPALKIIKARIKNANGKIKKLQREMDLLRKSGAVRVKK